MAYFLVFQPSFIICAHFHPFSCISPHASLHVHVFVLKELTLVAMLGKGEDDTVYVCHVLLCH